MLHVCARGFRMRFAALRPYGNPNITDHWDIMPVEYPTFQVLPRSNLTTNGTWSGAVRRGKK